MLRWLSSMSPACCMLHKALVNSCSPCDQRSALTAGTDGQKGTTLMKSKDLKQTKSRQPNL